MLADCGNTYLTSDEELPEKLKAVFVILGKKALFEKELYAQLEGEAGEAIKKTLSDKIRARPFVLEETDFQSIRDFLALKTSEERLKFIKDNLQNRGHFFHKFNLERASWVLCYEDLLKQDLRFKDSLQKS